MEGEREEDRQEVRKAIRGQITEGLVQHGKGSDFLLRDLEATGRF